MRVIWTGKIIDIKSKDVKIGDILCLHNDDKIVADIILLSYESLNNYCFIETSNLDGERNLKPKKAIIENVDLIQKY